MKNRKLFELEKGLNLTKFEHPMITHIIGKNKRTLKEFTGDILKTSEPTEEFNEYHLKLEAIAKRYCKRDELDKPIMKRVSMGSENEFKDIYDIPDDLLIKKLYNEELLECAKENMEVIKRREDQLRGYEELLDQESLFIPVMLDLELLVKYEKCPQEIMDLIYPIIKE